VQPIARGNILLAKRHDFPLARISFSNTPASGSDELAIEDALNAFLAAVVNAANKTEHVRCVMFAGVHSQLIFLAINKNRLPPQTPERKTLLPIELRFVHSQPHIA
jgi:hypothetical protein